VLTLAPWSLKNNNKYLFIVVMAKQPKPAQWLQLLRLNQRQFFSPGGSKGHLICL